MPSWIEHDGQVAGPPFCCDYASGQKEVTGFLDADSFPHLVTRAQAIDRASVETPIGKRGDLAMGRLSDLAREASQQDGYLR
jgi:hypothetical protein